MDALKSGKVGFLGLNGYEEKAEIFYGDLSASVVPDDLFSRLQTCPNVLITGHQALLTRNARENIGITTAENLSD